MSYRIKRKTKVTRKYRGTRSCGGGNAKNRPSTTKTLEGGVLTGRARKKQRPST